jgi:hypothetical protein
MFAPTKCVLSEYCALVLKMHPFKNLFVQAKSNLALLCDLECFLGLACLTSMIQALENLIKFNKARNYFIGIMMATVKFYQGDLYSQYVDPICAFTHGHIFEGFKDIFRNTSEHIVTKWVPYVNTHNHNLPLEWQILQS